MHVIAGIDARPDLELVGVWVSNPDKVGQDAGALAGLDRTLGVAATGDVDAVLALQPDVVVHTAMADDRLMGALADLQLLLRAGINVVSSGPVFLPLRQRRRSRFRQRRPPPGAHRGQRADR